VRRANRLLVAPPLPSDLHDEKEGLDIRERKQIWSSCRERSERKFLKNFRERIFFNFNAPSYTFDYSHTNHVLNMMLEIMQFNRK
jgi:hypothetical protein